MLLRPLLVLCAFSPALAHSGCDTTSGPTTRALLEVYTSEGCSSCPPADDMLRGTPTSDLSVVPLALHVTYWDYIGWRDPYASKAFEERQRWLARMNHHDGIGTPQVFAAGAEVPDWRYGLGPAIRTINADPAKAKITLHAGSPGKRLLGINASVTAPVAGKPALFLVVTESHLESKVNAGENQGQTLRHSYVAREWLGPFDIKSGKLSLRQQVTLADNYRAANLGVAAFVQDMDTGEVLQATAAYQCME